MDMIFEEKVQELIRSCDRDTLFKLCSALKDLGDRRTILDLSDKAFHMVEKVCLSGKATTSSSATPNFHTDRLTNDQPLGFGTDL